MEWSSDHHRTASLQERSTVDHVDAAIVRDHCIIVVIDF
jgi:hypothetical protein